MTWELPPLLNYAYHLKINEALGEKPKFLGQKPFSYIRKTRNYIFHKEMYVPIQRKPDLHV